MSFLLFDLIMLGIVRSYMTGRITYGKQKELIIYLSLISRVFESLITPRDILAINL